MYPNTFAAGQAVSSSLVNENNDYFEGKVNNIEDGQVAADAGIQQTKVASVLGNLNLREDVLDLDGRVAAIEGAETASLADVARLHRPRVENLTVSIAGSQATIPAGAYVTIRGSRLAIPAQDFNLTLGHIYDLQASIVDGALSVEAVDITTSTVEYVLATINAVTSGMDISVSKSKALNVIGAHGVVCSGGTPFDVAWEDGDVIQTSFPLETLVPGDALFMRLNAASNRDDESDTSVCHLARVAIASSGIGGVFINRQNKGQPAAEDDDAFESDWSNEIAVTASALAWAHLSIGSLPGPVREFTGFLAVKMKDSGVPVAYTLQPLASANVSVAGSFKGVCVVFRGDEAVIGIGDNFVSLGADSYSDTVPDFYDVQSIRVKLQGRCY